MELINKKSKKFLCVLLSPLEGIHAIVSGSYDAIKSLWSYISGRIFITIFTKKLASRTNQPENYELQGIGKGGLALT